MIRNDSTLLQLVSTGPVENYGDVLGRLQALEAELAPDDGLRWFNRLYTAMTANVIESARRHRFEDPVFVERLDCHFANLYFVALAAHLSDPGTGPDAWEPLFGARGRSDVLPVQLAVAGVNAHINRDLPVALVTTFLELDREPLRGTAAHGDYLHINTIIEETLRDAKSWLLTGTLSDVDVALGQLDDMLQLWSVKRAREAAWIAAEVRWALRASPVIARHHLEALDRMVGLAGRGLLLPLPHSWPSKSRGRSSPPSR